MKTSSKGRDNKVLILMPTGRDAELVRTTLEGVSISAAAFDKSFELYAGIAEGAGAILIAEEAVEARELDQLIVALEHQPVWSDIPVILFSSQSRNAELLLQRLGGRINVTIVERPIRITMLVSAVRGALRARQRQYQTRDLLIQLEQADQQKDLFLATLSHELRTPLNSILGWIQILRTKKVDPESTNRALEVIDRNARSQSEMISDILFVSRIITGKLEIKHEPIDIRDIVMSSVETVRPSAAARQLDLSIDAKGFDPAPIEGDAERLQQVVLNLLTNAVKFTPEGGRVTVALKRHGSNLQIEVADSGQGINPKFLPFVFERFRQADSTYTRRIGGLGLGLAIVRHLVELHGGEVSARSEGKDQGSTFVVTLPIADSRRMARAVRSERPEDLTVSELERLRRLRILVVEDDTDSREMLTLALTTAGVSVTPCETVAEAIEQLKIVKPHLIISDIGLPEEDGYDFIRRLRQLPASSGGSIPAIALTGYVSIQDRDDALAAGYHDHVSKPVDTGHLLRLILNLAPSDDREVGKSNGNAR